MYRSVKACRIMLIQRHNQTYKQRQKCDVELFLSVVSLSAADFIHTPLLDSSTFVSGMFSPSSNINQQAWFPETRNPLSKRKPSNTCISKDTARTWVKNQTIRLWGIIWSCTGGDVSVIYVNMSAPHQWLRSLIHDINCALLEYIILIRVCGSWELLHIHKNNGSASIFRFASNLLSLQSLGSTLFEAMQPTCALVVHKIAAFLQQELIDWPSMETHSLNESKQIWKSRPAKSLVSPYHSLGRQSRISCICGQTRPPPLPCIARLLQNHANVCSISLTPFLNAWNSHNHVVCFWS